jgi:hypothetical protein
LAVGATATMENCASSSAGTNVDRHIAMALERTAQYLAWRETYEGAFWLPALGTTAGVIVEDISGDLDLSWVGFAEAAQSAAREVCLAFGDAVVDQRME